LNVGKPKLLTPKTLLLPNVNEPQLISRAQTCRLPAAITRDHSRSRTRTEAYRCCFASVFVPISDENRDGGRAFPRTARVKPTPFRGSGPHSPPRWRTRGLRCDLSPALRKKRATSGTCLAGPLHLALGFNPSQLTPGRATHTLPPLRHTDRGVLAEPSNNTKK
jgi:hypothetical protein